MTRPPSRALVVDLRLSDVEIERIAARTAELVARAEHHAEGWLDVRRAGGHLGLTESAIRGLVKRRQIPFYRTENGRLRFAPTELDDWVRTGACETPARTYHDAP